MFYLEYLGKMFILTAKAVTIANIADDRICRNPIATSSDLPNSGYSVQRRMRLEGGTWIYLHNIYASIDVTTPFMKPRVSSLVLTAIFRLNTTRISDAIDEIYCL